MFVEVGQSLFKNTHIHIFLHGKLPKLNYANDAALLTKYPAYYHVLVVSVGTVAKHFAPPRCKLVLLNWVGPKTEPCSWKELKEVDRFCFSLSCISPHSPVSGKVPPRLPAWSTCCIDTTSNFRPAIGLTCSSKVNFAPGFQNVSVADRTCAGSRCLVTDICLRFL